MNQEGIKMSSRRADYWKRILFILPSLLLIAIFVAYPFIQGVIYSFTDWDGINVTKNVGFENYINLFRDISFKKALSNTIFFTAFLVVIMNPLALGMATILNKKIIGKNIFRTLIYIPTTISLIVVSNIWTLILTFNGFLNKLLELVGWGSHAVDWLGSYDMTPMVIVLIIVWQGLGNSMVFYLAALQGVPPELHEAARIDGATHWKKFRYITLPLIMTTVTVVLFLQISSMLKIFDIPYLMTAGGPGDATMTITMLIYDQAFRFNTAGYATTTGVVLMIFIIFVSVLQTKLTGSKEVDY